MPGYLSFLDRYERGASFLHRTDPRVKLVLTLIFIAAVTATPPGAWPIFLVLACALWGTVLASRLSIIVTLRRSAIAIPFILVAFPTIFTKGGEPLLSFSFFNWTLSATDEGLSFFLSVLVKSWISVIAAGTLALTTPFNDILKALRFLRLPSVLVAVMSLMYRYIFVLVEEAQRLRRAREARSARVQEGGGGSIPWQAKVTGKMVGSLFLHTYERGERIYQAMLSRGYSGEIVTLETRSFSMAQGVLVIGILLILAAVEVVASIYW